MQLGKNIRIHRRRLGLTQFQLAKDIVSVSYISLIENNKISPSFEVIRLLAERLETTVESLAENQFDSNKQIRSAIQNIEKHLSRLELDKALDTLTEIGWEENNVKENPLALILLRIRIQLLTGEVEAAETHLKLVEKDPALESDTALLIQYLLAKVIYYISVRQIERAVCCLYQLEQLHIVTELDQAFIYLLFSICQMKIGSFKASYQNIIKAQELYLQQGRWLEVGLVRYVNSLIDYKTGDLHSALKGLQSCEELLTILNHSRLLKHVYYSIGTISYHLGDMRMAIQSFSKSLQIQVEPDNAKLTAHTNYFLAEIFYSEKRYSLATEYIKRSLKIDKSFYLRAKNHILSAKIALSMNRAIEESGIQRAYRLALKSGSKTIIKESSTLLGSFYFQKGDYKRAAEYLFPQE